MCKSLKYDSFPWLKLTDTLNPDSYDTDISFFRLDLKKLCEGPKYAGRELDRASARKLWTRLTDLDVAAKLGDMTVGLPSVFEVSSPGKDHRH